MLSRREAVRPSTWLYALLSPDRCPGSIDWVKAVGGAGGNQENAPPVSYEKHQAASRQCWSSGRRESPTVGPLIDG